MNHQVVYQFLPPTLFPDRIAATASLWRETEDGMRPVEMIAVYGKRGDESERLLMLEVMAQALEKWGAPV